MRFRSQASLAASIAVCTLGAAGSAQAAPFSLVPPKSSTLSVARARAVDCGQSLTTGAGVVRRGWKAPAEGYLTARLAAATGDWDLAVFDEATGARLGASQAFGADEVVQAWARSGQELVLQACRRSGTARTARLSTGYAVGAWPKASGATQVVQIPLTNTRTQVPLLESLGFDVEETVTKDSATATITSATQLTALRTAGFKPKVLETDLLGSIRDNLAKDRRSALASRRASVLPSGRETYRVYEDYQAELKKLVTDHPTTVKPVTLPKKTFQGRDTIGVEVSGNVNATDDQKPTSFIMGVHHAREWPAAELVQELAIHLADQYGKDPEITSLLDRVRVVIVPIINGDGFIASRGTAFDPADTFGSADLELVEGALLPVGGTLAYRRKNCRSADPSGLTPCVAAYGVDPNRNYGFKWGGPGASTSINSQTFRGTGQWSEPETQAVHEFSQVRNVTSLMTVHTIAGLVLRPPGLSVDGKAPDEAALKELGDAIAGDTGYKSQFSFELYDTSGTTEDWNYGAAGTFGYTVELGPTDAGFHGLYADNVTRQWTGGTTGPTAGKGMRSGFLRMIEKAASKKDFSTIAGVAPAGRTIRVKKNFDTFSSPVCTLSTPTDVSLGGTECIAAGDAVSQPDKLEYKTKVSAKGTFSWIVTPSTPPFTKAKGGSESWTLTCEDDAGTVYDTRTVSVYRDETRTLSLPCGKAAAPVPEIVFPTTNPTPEGTKALAAIAAAQVTSTPATTPAGVTTAPVVPGAASLLDKLAPRSKFTKAKLRASRKAITLRGTSADLAPQGLAPRLAKVAVSIGRRTGSSCQFLVASGKLGPKVSCLRTSYLPAKGTSSWSFTKAAKLPKGKYLAWVRGTDAVQNVERKAKARNLITFTIK